MNKFPALVLCFFCASFALAQTKDSTLIEAHIEGIGAGKMRLVGVYGDQNFLADSATVDENGKFTLRRAKPLSPGFYTLLLPGTKNFSILIDKEQFFTLRGNAADFVNTLQAEGCTETQLFYENLRFQARQEPELSQVGEAIRKNPANSEAYLKAKARQTQLMEDRKAHLEELYKKHPDSFFRKFKTAGANPDFPDFKKPNGDLDTLRNLRHYRAKFWDNVDFNDIRLMHTPVIANKLKRYIKELTPQHPDSIIAVADPLVQRVLPYKEYFKFFANWIGLAYENGKTNVMDGEAVYVYLIKKYMTKEYAFWSNDKEIEALQKHVWEMEASLMGRKGPDVRAQDVNGQFKSIYEMAAPLVVVFMFSPDCEHCQKEAPDIQRLYEKWKTRGVDFYGIAVNTNEEEWRKFVKQQGFTFTNVFDPTNRAIYAKYFVDITPELYILNKDRTIVAKNLKATQLETIFERELRKMGK